ncbi:hypothetical protein Fcan01_12870 [Folsomia candida]|uniref:Uncharacterized protein n=1 Tax=Folsomia candida TaxID=158441 RepID=A0A226E4C4_FOLCA|nr:hypothetical protein Fcan01_12870 [Folsomia candida]
MKPRPGLVQHVGYTSSVVGVFGATNSGGLNFKMSPHYSSNECQENNLKAMIVAMMMHDKLDEDELTILMHSIQFVYEASSEKRKQWCGVEIKNFMNCSEQYDFQDKKCAVDLHPPKLSVEPPAWPYNSPGKYKPPNLRKLPLSKCPLPSSIDADTTGYPSLVGGLEVNNLDQCCGCEDEGSTSNKCTSSCRPCGCTAKTEGIMDEQTDKCDNKEDPWQVSQISHEDTSTIIQTPNEEGHDRLAYEACMVPGTLEDESSALDYDEWYRQHGDKE